MIRFSLTEAPKGVKCNLQMVQISVVSKLFLYMGHFVGKFVACG